MAQNIYISAIYLGNTADLDPYEGNWTVENAEDLLGSYGSAANPLSQSVVTIDSDSPTGYVDADHDTGDGTLTYDLGSGSTTVGLDSMVEYQATITFEDGTSIDLKIDIVQTTNGDLFFVPFDPYTVLGDKPIESIDLTAISFNSWNGFYQTSYDNVAFVCFATGTRIATPRGLRPVEDLGPGDEVLTRDNGACALVWTGRRDLRFPPSPDRQKPVLLRKGSLGRGAPIQDLILSPQHRILLTDPGRSARSGETEVFAAAHSFTGLPGVRRMRGRRQVTYHAVMCAGHEVIEAEGVAVESFLPGPEARNLLSAFEMLDLRARCPSLVWAPPSPARPIVPPPHARRLIAASRLAHPGGRSAPV